MKKRLFQFFLHASIWTALLVVPLFSRPRGGIGTEFTMNFKDVPPTLWIINAWLVSIFYLNYHIVTPLYLKGRYLLFLSLTLLMAFILFTLDFFFQPTLNLPMVHPNIAANIKPMIHSQPRILIHFPLLLMFMITDGVAFGLRIMNQWKQTQQEKLEVELSYLKAQINPHFLFNTLNNIYSLTLLKSDQAPHAVLKLSAIMRYSISYGQENYVELERELAYLGNFIDLQKLRLPAQMDIRYFVRGDAGHNVITPFLLIPFIENAFKHGVNTVDDTHIQIDVLINGNFLSLDAWNRKVSVLQSEEPSGIGIENTRQRLEILYASRHTLVIEDLPGEFRVQLKMKLK